jgi:hypothetical protein
MCDSSFQMEKWCRLRTLFQQLKSQDGALEIGDKVFCRKAPRMETLTQRAMSVW